MNSRQTNPLAITIAGLLLLTALPTHADRLSTGINGFRIASVPEPSAAMLILASGTIGYRPAAAYGSHSCGKVEMSSVNLAHL